MKVWPLRRIIIRIKSAALFIVVHEQQLTVSSNKTLPFPPLTAPFTFAQTPQWICTIESCDTTVADKPLHQSRKSVEKIKGEVPFFSSYKTRTSATWKL